MAQESRIPSSPTVMDLLRAAAGEDADRRGYTFIPSGGADETHLSYRELDARARAVAVALRRAGVEARPDSGDRVLVVFPAGFDFLTGFLGALYAGAIAVPVRYPGRGVDHLSNIAADSGAKVGLTTEEMQPVLTRALGAIRWLTPADLASGDADDWHDPGLVADDVAYLQYTSGSTAAPKGVMIHHRHVIANCRHFSKLTGMDRESRVLTWLPHFHDFGLVYGLFAPLYNRCAGFFLSPMTFAQRPASWLEAMSRLRITHTGAPNFAYQACLGIAPAQREGLDLSSLRVCVNGAEPVRADTLDAFARSYAPHGFRAQAMCPAYGLAETTLIATVSPPGDRAVEREVDADALADGTIRDAASGLRALQLVSSGPLNGAFDIAVVDPQTGERRRPGRIGEIWIAGDCVAGGYWHNHEATTRKFGARIPGADGGPYLRTGDLGFVADGELFVLGRMDDLIIVRGANYAPEDIELSVEGADPALQLGGGIAVAAEIGGAPRLAVFHEIERKALRTLEPEAVVKAILRTVSEKHQLEVAGVVLLKPRTLPRTHSGKKQRHACRRALLHGDVQGVHVWMTPALRDALNRAPASIGAAIEAARGGDEETPKPEVKAMRVMDGEKRATHRAAPQQGADAAKVKDVTGWLRSYAQERLNSRLMDERRTMPPYVVLDLGNRGVLGLQAPERFGGLALGNRAYVRVLEQLAAIDLTLGSFVTVNNCLGVRPILLHASDERRAELLPILAPGRELAAFAMTEPGAGSNVRGIAAQGRSDGTGAWRLFGTKVWSGSAAWAGVINTFVRIDDGEPGGPRGVTGFVVRQPSPGLRMGPEALTMGLRAMIQNEVRLEGVRVAEADMLGQLGKGMDAAMETMEFGRFSIASLGLGVMKRCLQLMVRHAGRRSIATGKLLANPVTLVRISDLTAAATAVEALIEVVADRLDRKLAVPAELYCACKSAGGEFAWRAADQLVQLYAGRGYIETNLAPQILRDTRILRIFEGPSEPMNMHIGSRLAQRPEDLCRLIAEDLGQPTLAAELQVAAARILDRCTAMKQMPDAQAARQWAFSQAGEVGAYGILLACIRHRARLAPSALLQRAGDWARMRFDRRLAKALSMTAAESVLLDAGEAERTVADYVETIGDVEQQMPDEQRHADPMLARDSADGAPIRVETGVPAVNGHAAPAAGDTERTREIRGWLADWLAQNFDLPASGIASTDMFSEFGLDSVRAMMLINELEDRLQVALPPTLIWDYPSVGELAHHLANLDTESAARASVAPACAAPRNGAAAHDAPGILARLDQLSGAEIQSLLAAIPDAD